MRRYFVQIRDFKHLGNLLATGLGKPLNDKSFNQFNQLSL